MEPDALVVLLRRMSQEWTRDLEMLQVMTSKGYFLARTDTVRESSSFCSTVSSPMSRLHLRACEKTIFLYSEVSGWNGSVEVRQSLWIFCTGLLKVCGLILCGS